MSSRIDEARRIVSTLSPTERQQILASWVEEAERRLDEIESGKVQAVPADEVFAEFQARLRG